MNTNEALTLGIGAVLAFGLTNPLAAQAVDPEAQIDATVTRAGAQVGSPALTDGNKVAVDGLDVVIVGQTGQAKTHGRRSVWREGRTKHVAIDTDQGSQFLSVHGSRDGLTSIYDFPGTELQALPGGEVAIVKDDNLVGHIETPWAKDAAGTQVPTRYHVSGSRLVQEIHPTPKTVFPVVADPTVVRKWYGSQVRFSKSETQKIGYGATGCTIVTAAIPDPTASKVATAACAALALAADIALDNGKCLAANVFYTGNVVPWYWSC